MRYLITGHPLNPLFDENLRHRGVGEVYEADLDPDVERVLIGAGALQPLGDAERVEQPPVSRPAEPAETELPATATDPTIAPKAAKRARKPPQDPDQA